MFFHYLAIYSAQAKGRGPSLKMQFFLFRRRRRFFGVADFALWTLIGSRPRDTFFVVSRTVLE